MINKQGLLLCARYSVAPNFFGYCGPDENTALVDHLKEKVADKEMRHILSEFETLFLNLTLIATENKILDIFDKQVVEAYWIGNGLLSNISNSKYNHLLDEKFNLEKKLGEDKFGQLKYKIRNHRFYPHHSFHVFNIFKRTGHDPSFHTLKTMDECRIGWGQVKKTQNSKFKIQNFIQVQTMPLIFKENKLLFGEVIIKNIQLDYKGKQFIHNYKEGDWVSFHWGHVCDILNIQQIKQLLFYTQKAIDFFNQS